MLQRHDLLHISVPAAQRIFSRWQTSRVAWQQAFVAGELPGIVRRPVEGESQNEIALGFSFPERVNGQRQRLASTVMPDEVICRLTPFEIAQRAFAPRTPALMALADLRERFTLLACVAGVWGSTALEIVSGFHYTDCQSDLDIVIDIYPVEQLHDVYQCLLQLEQTHHTRIDVEVRWPTGYGINLKEFMTTQGQILGKSLNDVRLFDKQALLAGTM
ncbi:MULTISPECIES: malonate decarboxylase holo-[acyl-carrier-protein] synthase [Citrobacter]|uniref:Malonate decarboxylase holo-[acyl-carrier-protein] synthase n=1 Tax=Citrobacter telavivensis TaxID=2653932 RepID=A0A6L5E7I1_9ENTR|nr:MULTISPECIES: malonate decarboxylase holo-[acyl-carrier-protein] synthase [Citrobacter]MPQ51442.1 malonate decarboxylase holo-[acyl-carrier-protein] synthase [Citrobacter telavivensis]QFS73184.1 malonate decarboxylase holo-[acyl-carrier-protein] synthase [Citrobacter telavivensis]CAI9397129.1 Phosphoribosyl-dephospho-CoA transferase [Citrobacter sp. T1.2D-1]